MCALLRRLVLAAALLVMPLQGVAVTLSVLLCHGDLQAQVMHAGTGGHHTVHGESPPSDGGTGGNFPYHPCCHNFVSATTIAAPLAALPDFPVRTSAPDPLHDLFVPEQPQRPPLA